MFTALIFVVTFKVALETTTWVALSWIIFVWALISYLLWAFFYSVYPLTMDMYYVFIRLTSMPSFHLYVLLVIVVCCIPDVLAKYYRIMYAPDSVDIGRYYPSIMERKAQFRDQRRQQLLKRFLSMTTTKRDSSTAISIPRQSLSAVSRSEQAEYKRGVEIELPSSSEVPASNVRKPSTYQRRAEQMQARSGYVDWLEHDKDKDFVMPQNTVLQIKLGQRSVEEVDIDDSSSDDRKKD